MSRVLLCILITGIAGCGSGVYASAYVRCTLDGKPSFESAPSAYASKSYRSSDFQTDLGTYYNPKPGELCEVVR